MTDHTPLTDEELAAIEVRLTTRYYLGPEPPGETNCGSWFTSQTPDDVARLIADLRASRADVERLRETVDYETYARIRDELAEARSEIERLRSLKLCKDCREANKELRQ